MRHTPSAVSLASRGQRRRAREVLSSSTWHVPSRSCGQRWPSRAAWPQRSPRPKAAASQGLPSALQLEDAASSRWPKIAPNRSSGLRAKRARESGGILVLPGNLRRSGYLRVRGGGRAVSGGGLRVRWHRRSPAVPGSAWVVLFALGKRRGGRRRGCLEHVMRRRRGSVPGRRFGLHDPRRPRAGVQLRQAGGLVLLRPRRELHPDSIQLRPVLQGRQRLRLRSRRGLLRPLRAQLPKHRHQRQRPGSVHGRPGQHAGRHFRAANGVRRRLHVSVRPVLHRGHVPDGRPVPRRREPDGQLNVQGRTSGRRAAFDRREVPRDYLASPGRAILY